jgi:hypothetical protein
MDQPQVLRLTNDRALLPPGRWELSLTPPAGYYVSGFAGQPARRGGGDRPDGWNEILVGGYSTVRFTVSAGPGSMHGVVKSGGDISPGAPVYLEAYDPETRKRSGDLRVTRTDLRGGYRFDELAPGVYRVLATFEYQAPDTASMELAGARSTQVDAHGDLQLDLDLYIVR